MNCCPAAMINSLTHHHHHHHNLHQHQQNSCIQNSLSHLLSLTQQQQQQQAQAAAAALPLCSHYHHSLPQSVAESMYLSSNPSLGLPMVSANTSPSSNLLFSPAASSIISELVLQSTGVLLPHHNAMVSLGGLPVLPVRNDLVTTALERMLAQQPPSSWTNQPYASLATALRMPLFSNVVAEEMHI